MKVRHKVNHGWAPDHTDAGWAEQVEREAERITDATEHAWRKAQERLTRAVQRAEAEEHRKTPDRKKVRRLWAAVEARRQELLNLQRLAQASPAGAQHRGRGSHRAVTGNDPL